MLVGIGPLAVTDEIPPDNISVQFAQLPGGMRQKILIYFMDVKGTVGKIELTPFEFMKISEQGRDLIHTNKVRV